MPKVRVIQATKGTLADKLPVAAYCRVSSNSEDQRHSFVAQVKEYTARIAENDKWELAGIYADKGITGTSARKRPEFQRLIEDCRQGKVKRILTKSISRFARNTQECLEYVRELKILGVSVYFEKEGLDTADIAGELLISVFGSLAQEESTSIGCNMRLSYKYRMEQGQFVGCCAPFGYFLINGTLVINEPEAAVIRQIFEWYLSGVRRSDILTRLNAIQQPGLSSMKWNLSSLGYILRNERYTGDALLQKKYTPQGSNGVRLLNRGELPQYYVEMSHPAIISKDTFQKVQQLCAMRKAGMPVVAAPKKAFFAHKVYCYECGHAFRKKKQPNGSVRWICKTHDEGSEKCPTPPIADAHIRSVILNTADLLAVSIDTILLPMAAQLRRLRERSIMGNEDINALNQQILSLTDQLHAVSKLHSMNILDISAFREKSNAINAQLDEAQRKRKLLISGAVKDDKLEKTEAIISILQDIKQSPASLEDGGVFEQIVDKVLVDKGKKIVFRLINGLELTGAEENSDGEK